MVKFNNSEHLLNYLNELIRQKLDENQATKLIAFAQYYFKGVSQEDLEGRVPEDLYGALLVHWNLALNYKPGSQKVHVYNPTLEDHSWQSKHTIIDIVIEDMPFLLQSITMEINQHGFASHFLIHPVFNVSRSKSGELISLTPGKVEDEFAECFLHLEIDRQSSRKVLDKIQHCLSRILEDVRAATQDWTGCMNKMAEVIDQLRASSLYQTEQGKEATQFLQWLHDDHFVFLGYREYDIVVKDGVAGFKVKPGTGLGVLRDSIARLPKAECLTISDDAYETIASAKPIMITKATSKSTVHRSVFMDYIGVRQLDDDGNIIGEKRFLGLYSSSAYTCELKSIPMVGSKMQRLMQRSGFQRSTHGARALLYVLQSLPRDELFQADEDSLLDCALGVLQLQGRQRVRVFVRHDVYGFFVSLLIFVPRERYHTESRKKIQNILLTAFHGQNVDFNVQLSESILARIHFIIHSTKGCNIEYDVKELEAKIVDVLADWRDDLKAEMLSYFGEAKGNELFGAYGDGFSAAYREEVSARTALLDIERFEHMQKKNLVADGLLYSPLTAAGHKTLHFKLFSCGQQASLSRSLPILENMGVKVCNEKPYRIKNKNLEQQLWVHDFGLIYGQAGGLDVEKLKPSFQEAVEHAWFGRIENDGFNVLVIKAGLDWRQVNIFRAYYLYMRQLEITFSQAYVESALANNPVAIDLLVKLFYARFDPKQDGDEKRVIELQQAIEAEIDQVSSLDEDRILRRYLNLIQSAVRTNYFINSLDDSGVPFFATKFDSSLIIEMPLPVPYFEVFVYSPRMEGIHLRGGAVARGGLRWSDRREDFRTEVLGLMKAQMTKNAVIVPTGAKGGFFVKRLNEIVDKEQARQEVVQCYQILIRGLLEITDNLDDDGIVKPENVRCYDQDDPYLVVAADKGTATFSDYANKLSKRYNYWLGDAFASGGSVGYDHKAMGITARGAWESVKHNFNLLGPDIRTTPFTVVGIGGMAGDVFGNGMLLSDKIKLVAVFDHEYIFIDPDPDPELSYQERKRLFSIARVSWSDYSPKLISKGGGVYSRSLKSITLSKQAQERLGIDVEKVIPQDLIKIILCAPVDLLWNGGIGTYVKACDELNIDVGDRANDATRVNGKQLRCRQVAEGGNLGFTQRGRIEYAMNRGRINTDSIDNSAGVDCSDYEVNIKILLNKIMRNGDLTEKLRNELLVQMTDQVADLVLAHNYQQNRAITMIEKEALDEWSMVRRLIDMLEARGGLDRALENIPSDEQMAERYSNNQGLTRPEISVLLSYSKKMLKEELLPQSELLNAQVFDQALLNYFPDQLQQQYPEEIKKHSLAKEIVVNQLINNLVNQQGMMVPYKLMIDLGCSVVAVLNVYHLVCQVFGIDKLLLLFKEHENQLEAELQHGLNLTVRKTIERAMYWFLVNEATREDSGSRLEKIYIQGIAELSSVITELLPEQEQEAIDKKIDELIQQGVSAGMALNIVLMDKLYHCLDVVLVQKKTSCVLQDAAKVYFSLIEKFDLAWVRQQILVLPRGTVWEALARRTMREEFNVVCSSLTIAVLNQQGRNIGEKLENWLSAYDTAIQRYLKLLAQVRLETDIDLEKITVLFKELRSVENKI